jgi:hypothetical protein
MLLSGFILGFKGIYGSSDIMLFGGLLRSLPLDSSEDGEEYRLGLFDIGNQQ